ncbi:hypothetical protein [Virgibacillus salexigens]|uniref:Uncharacterized protein n=1 Tax=Virgibacillus massiliensis TaxID=1462526 RepID=A0A024QJ19_9BACI|nr:hypothetical protein [Virgibacillus massiliensis]CDQ41941.1 hypothetical protein BN990_04320 [Virgibacillus massiliensis]
MGMTIDKAIFITNVFADFHPKLHTELWQQFEHEVSKKERSGIYGVENMAYISWLKKKENPEFLSFMHKQINVKSF